MPRITKAALEESIEYYQKKVVELKDQIEILKLKIRVLEERPHFQVLTAAMSINKTAREIIDKALAVGGRMR